MFTLYLHVTENGLDVINIDQQEANTHHKWLKDQCHSVRLFTVTHETDLACHMTADYIETRLADLKPVGRKAMTYCTDTFGVAITLR